MSKAHKGWWVWSNELEPEDEPFDIEEFARGCIDQFRTAWVELGVVLEEAVSSVIGPLAPTALRQPSA